MVERLLCLLLIACLYVMATALLTAFERSCRLSALLHTQDACSRHASAASCRERAEANARRARAHPDAGASAVLARTAVELATRVEWHLAAARYHEREARVCRFLE